MQPKDAYTVFCYLNSQPIVRAKFANGKTVTWQDTKNRVETFCNRFDPKKNQDDSYLWSGFIVAVNDNDAFLGYANLGFGGEGQAEMAYLNRPDAWSCTTPEIVQSYEIDDSKRLSKSYTGIATVEASSLLQYAEFLKHRGRTIRYKEISGVVATARLDNPGSWKACAKSGMEVKDIDAHPSYGPELRYQLLYSLS